MINYEKKLFAYGIYMLGISSVISALIVICTSSLLLASKDIKYKNGVVESEVIVMHDGKQVYATHNYSEIQLQNILLTAKNGSLTYRENGVIYRVSQQTYKDGAILLRLSPVIDIGYAEKLIFVLYAASFVIIYILVLFARSQTDRARHCSAARNAHRAHAAACIGQLG